MKSSLHLFRIKGIPVGLNWTWIFVFALVFWSLGSALFPATYPGLSGSTYLIMALIATGLLFASILVHELSHTMRALREGVRVREITLWLFGGVSRAEEPLPDPGAEFRVVLAGPVASAVLAVVFLGLAGVARAAGLSDPIVGVADYLARINGLLLAFNLIPALPLDGGRILHAALWRRTGDRAAATISAAKAGRAFGVLLVAIGLLGLLNPDVGSVWFLFLGWFLLQAVHEEVLAARVEQAVETLSVRDIMVPDPVAVSPGMTIEEFRTGVVRRSPHAAYPVVDRGQVLGLLPLRQAIAVAPRDRASVRVADVMLEGGAFPVVHPNDPAIDALEQLQDEPRRAVVLDGTTGKELVGIVSLSDVALAVDEAPHRPATTRKATRRSGTFGIWLVVGAVLVIAAAALYHPPYVVIAPGESFDVRGDIAISGVPTQEPTGPYLMTSVTVSQPSALGLLVAALRNDRQVLSAGDVVPPGVSPGQVDEYERQLFLDSQKAAAAAAARAAGYNPTFTGHGAEVVGIVRSSPAAKVLKPGDTITAVENGPVATAADLHAALPGRVPGQPFSITVDRGGRTLHLQITTAQLPAVSGGSGIGIIAETKDLNVVLPFSISFRERPDIGGPSAGLAYALAISDMLDPGDDARGRHVAATGTIDGDGSVGPVGGVHEKAIAARDEGADLFLVPADEATSVRDRDLTVRGVEDLAGALQFLRA